MDLHGFFGTQDIQMIHTAKIPNSVREKGTRNRILPFRCNLCTLSEKHPKAYNAHVMVYNDKYPENYRIVLCKGCLDRIAHLAKLDQFLRVPMTYLKKSEDIEYLTKRENQKFRTYVRATIRELNEKVSTFNERVKNSKRHPADETEALLKELADIDNAKITYAVAYHAAHLHRFSDSFVIEKMERYIKNLEPNRFPEYVQPIIAKIKKQTTGVLIDVYQQKLDRIVSPQ